MPYGLLLPIALINGEPPYAEPHVRWCERSENESRRKTTFVFLLLDSCFRGALIHKKKAAVLSRLYRRRVGSFAVFLQQAGSRVVTESGGVLKQWTRLDGVTLDGMAKTE